MTRRAVLLVVVLAGTIGWMLLRPEAEFRADPKRTKPCGDITCPVNELCCFEECLRVYGCFPRRTGKCPSFEPCP